MRIVLSILMAAGLAVGLYVLSALSRKLGEVLKLKALWRVFALSELLLAAAVATGLLWPGRLVIALVVGALAITISVIAALRYWGWALAELLKGKKD